MKLEVTDGRKQTIYTKSEQRQRITWAIVNLFFRFSPRTAFMWRAWILRRLGAEIGENVHIYPDVKIFLPSLLKIGDNCAIGERAIVYNLGKVTIGDSVTISQGAHICAGTHDFRDSKMPLQRCTITIKDNAWICADAFVGPNVLIGNGSIIGARSVITRDVDDWIIMAGNPASALGERKINCTSEP